MKTKQLTKKTSSKETQTGFNLEPKKKSKIALFWESDRPPGIRIVDMRAVLK
ncbi:MAG: hypothetical protein LBT25_07580 [Candidatus Symbiothrix sp.]|jgi:hypothetical protein|nr:hypothetical protein [Candidatus Symbiothrix sp.]